MNLSARRIRSGTVSTTMLGQLRAQDPDAWRRLTELVGPVVYRWCRKANVQPNDADNIVQDVFQSVYVGLAGFSREKPEDSFRGWLWTIAHRKRMDFFRRQQKTPVAFGGTDAAARIQQHEDVMLPPEETPEDAADSDQLIMQRAIEMIRDDFSEKVWQAFWQTAINDRESPEVAEELGMSRDSIRQAKSRVLRRLRTELTGLLRTPTGLENEDRS
jgi:RNA polymerase sigma-70 factor, ECF subfamily